ILRRRERFQRELADQCAAAFKNAFCDLLVLSRIDDVHAGTENSYGLAFALNGSAMSRCIHATCHAAEDRQAARGEIATQALGHPYSVRRGMPRTDDGQARA